MLEQRTFPTVPFLDKREHGLQFAHLIKGHFRKCEGEESDALSSSDRAGINLSEAWTVKRRGRQKEELNNSCRFLHRKTLSLFFFLTLTSLILSSIRQAILSLTLQTRSPAAFMEVPLSKPLQFRPQRHN